MNEVVIADTSGLLAVFDADSQEHPACREALASTGHLVISPLVLAELDYLLTTQIGPQAAMAALDFVMGRIDVKRYEVPEVGSLLRTARAVMGRCSSLSIGLTDAVNVALAAEFRTDAVLTLDRRHFRTVRPLTGHQAFRLLPDGSVR